MAVSFVTSERGCLKLCEGGFVYYFERENSEGVHWKCQYAKKFRCRARVTTHCGEIVRRSEKQHNHTGDAASVEATKIMSQIREVAKSTTDAPKIVVADALSLASQGTIGALPPVMNMKRNIANYRKKINEWPALPKKREDIDLTGMCTTKGGDDFLLYDSGPGDSNRMIVFGTQENLARLKSCKRWFADGTFKTVPKLFYQLYTVHGCRKDKTYPLIYALLPNKQRKTYLKLLRELKRLRPDLNPCSISSDFETAAIKAFKVSNRMLLSEI